MRNPLRGRHGEIAGPAAYEKARRPLSRRDFVARLTSAQPRLYGFIRTLAPEPHAIEEIIQETNLTLWEQADRFEGDTDFMAWACRVAYFKVIDYRRVTQRNRHWLCDDVVLSLGQESLEDLETSERQRAALAACLVSLSARHRRVVEMHYHEGITIEGIAETIDRKKNAVSQLLFRIRQILRECIRRKLAEPSA